MPKKRSAPQAEDLAFYMSLHYPCTVEEVMEEGEIIFSLSITDLPGCGAEGKTLAKAYRRLLDAKEVWLQAALEAGLPIPQPDISDEFSGRFILRIPPGLHMKLSRIAATKSISLNQFIRSILEEATNNQVILAKLQAIENSLDELKRGSMIKDVKPGAERQIITRGKWDAKQPDPWTTLH